MRTFTHNLMNVELLQELERELWSDIADGFHPSKSPLLSHYTSIGVFEQILKNKEIWLTQPLFMNDWQELQRGMIEGRDAFRNHVREPLINYKYLLMNDLS